MKTTYDIVRDSLLMALQDLDDPDLSEEELKHKVAVAKAKAGVASSLASYQKSLVEAERLRQEYGNSMSADAMIGEDEAPKLRLEDRKYGKT